MSNEATIVVSGNTTDAAELRYTNSGLAIAKWTLVVTPRTKGQDGQWADGEPTFYRCSAFKQLAESCAESITKGMRLVVYGRFKARSYETQAGEKRTSLEIDVDDVGASMRYATVSAQKASRSGGQQQSAPLDDPWGSTANQPAPDELAPF